MADPADQLDDEALALYFKIWAEYGDAPDWPPEDWGDHSASVERAAKAYHDAYWYHRYPDLRPPHGN